MSEVAEVTIREGFSIKRLELLVLALIVLSLFVGCAVRRTLVLGCEAYTYATYAPEGGYVQPTTLNALAQSDWSTSTVIKNNPALLSHSLSAGPSDSESRSI